MIEKKTTKVNVVSISMNTVNYFKQKVNVVAISINTVDYFKQKMLSPYL